MASLPLTLLASVCAVVASSAAVAAEPELKLSGFATIAVGKTNTAQAQLALAGQTRGYTDKVGTEVDSKLGLQAHLSVGDDLSATAQVLTRQNGKGKFTPSLEWGFFRARLSPELTVRAGRMGTPYFMVSDYRSVGYANTWLRPPIDVYGQVGYSHHDGMDVTYQTSFGSSTVTLSTLAGQSSDVYENVDLDLKRMVGFNATVEFGNGLTARLGHVQGKLSFASPEINGLAAGLRAAGYADVGNQVDANGEQASFSGIGLSYDESGWVASAEYTKRRTQSFIADTTGWYLTLGHRFGNVLPYVTVSDLKRNRANVVNTVPAGVSALAPLREAVDAVVAGQDVTQRSVAVGIRWDVARNTAFKAQWDRVDPKGTGLFIRTSPTFGGKPVNLFAVSLDVVF